MEYRISGIWKDAQGTITHYAMHPYSPNASGKPTKVTKAKAIEMVEDKKNEVWTRVWSYTEVAWKPGEQVQVVDEKNGKYLRSNRDNKLSDNLGHLINYGTIF